MAPAIHHSFSLRDYGVSASSSKGLPTLVIVGFIVAGVIAFLVCAWLLIRFFRKRARAQREDERGGAFLTVRGIAKEGEVNEKEG
jgi:hypothetical protein